MKATFDFDKKTIKFEGQYKIADVHIIQDLLGADWQEWTVVQEWAGISAPSLPSLPPFVPPPLSPSPHWEWRPSPPWPGQTVTVTGGTDPLTADKYKAT